jgi:hypothetical protein
MTEEGPQTRPLQDEETRRRGREYITENAAQRRQLQDWEVAHLQGGERGAEALSVGVSQRRHEGQ